MNAIRPNTDFFGSSIIPQARVRRCIYSGTFAGLGPRPDVEVDWKIELYRESAEGSMMEEPKELKFPIDPLEITWDQWKPEQAVQGSMATLKIESMTDREFIDFYTQKTGEMWMKVYRRTRDMQPQVKDPDTGWHLVWRGSLDPEFYEEPYESLNGYTVTLTFSDFGALDRLDFRPAAIFGNRTYQIAGLCNIEQLVGAAMAEAGMIDALDEWVALREKRKRDGLTMISGRVCYTQFYEMEEWVQLADLHRISVLAANFFDEKGEPSSWRDVLEAVLLPFGLHIVQRGNVLIYDTASLIERAGAGWPIHWSSDSQTLSAAETYSKVTVNFNPYQVDRIVDPDLRPDPNGKITQNSVWLNMPYEDSLKLTSTQLKAHVWESFRMWTSPSGYGAEYCTCNFFKIIPINGSMSEATGVKFPRPNLGTSGSYFCWTNPGETLLQLEPKYIPPVAIVNNVPRTGYSLLLKLDMLLSAQYNPFEDSGKKHDETGSPFNNYEAQRSLDRLAQWVLLPVRILLRDANGNVTHYYRNDDLIFKRGADDELSGTSVRSYLWTAMRGRWVERTDETTENDMDTAAYLMFYDTDLQALYDNKDGTVTMSGWTANKPTLGIRGLFAYASQKEFLNRRGDGMAIPYPPTEGFIDISFMRSIYLYPIDDRLLLTAAFTDGIGKDSTNRPRMHDDSWNIMSKVKWWMIKDVSLEVRRSDELTSRIESGNIETTGDLCTGAREELSIDTICGTASVPTEDMRGLLRIDRKPIMIMARGEMGGSPEQILIGNLFSQYATRRDRISGEATETISKLPIYSDANQGEKLFILEKSTLSAREGVEDIALLRIFPEMYSTAPDIDPPVPPTSSGKFTTPDDRVNWIEQSIWSKTDGEEPTDPTDPTGPDVEWWGSEIKPGGWD